MVLSVVVVVELLVVGRGVVMGILLGVEVVVATKIGILELKLFPLPSFPLVEISFCFCLDEFGSHKSCFASEFDCAGGLRYHGGNGLLVVSVLGLQV